MVRAGSWLARRSVRARLARLLTHALLIFVGAIFILPFVWQVSTSLKPIEQVYKYPPEWIPRPFMWRNYIESLRSLPFARYFLNSAIVTVPVVIGQVLACSLAGFAFARLRWWGRNTLFLIMLSTMMLPTQVTLVPQFILFSRLRWVNSFYPLIVPGLFAGPFFTFLARQFLSSISPEMDDAARVDGASTLRIYWQIILPMSKSLLATIATFTFHSMWNDYLYPLIYLHSSELHTLALGLANFRARAFFGGMRWDLMMAATTVAMLPIVIVFVFVQRYFIQGIVITGVKG